MSKSSVPYLPTCGDDLYLRCRPTTALDAERSRGWLMSETQNRTSDQLEETRLEARADESNG